MQLTVRDVSRVLNVSEKTVYRWIKNGRLPAYQISGRYRFDQAELQEWISARRISAAPGGPGAPAPELAATPSLAEALEAGGIHYRVSGLDKPSVLRAVVEALPLPEEADRGALLCALLARESMASTGIGDGIAIPHARDPNILAVSRSMMALCFLERPVDFGALDGKPVSYLFVVMTPSLLSHLRLISRLMFALRDAGFREVIHRQGLREGILDEARRIEGTLEPSDSS